MAANNDASYDLDVFIESLVGGHIPIRPHRRLDAQSSNADAPSFSGDPVGYNVRKHHAILNVRRGASHRITFENQEVVVGHRAESLAARIEEGAARLAAFAQKLTEEEWNTPVNEGKDDRTIGVIVHHVAFMYPIEIDVAKAVAAGNAVTDVSWEAVADINAGHARENASATKEEALALLRRNSRDAAEVVRRFTDEELDRAAPFSLSYDAPMTAQFVVEDHALRHSWHHLARIRAALSRLVERTLAGIN